MKLRCVYGHTALKTKSKLLTNFSSSDRLVYMTSISWHGPNFSVTHLHTPRLSTIAELITLHDCLSHNGGSWSCCGLHITSVIGDRGSHITRHFTGRNPLNVCLVCRLRHGQQNIREKSYVKKTRDRSSSLQKSMSAWARDPSCCCCALIFSKKRKKRKKLLRGACLIAVLADVLLQVLQQGFCQRSPKTVHECKIRAKIV